VFIDYKTGEAKGQRAKDSSGKAKLDVQLLVYASAAQQIDPDLAVANAYYYSIRDGEQKKATNQADDPSVQALIERLRTHLSTGSYPVEPDRDYQACNFCEAGAACRCVQP
jgi:ATP-dependent helicase/DNAse subunit B